MDGICDELFPCAGLSPQEHRTAARSHLLDHFPVPAQAEVRTHDFIFRNRTQLIQQVLFHLGGSPSRPWLNSSGVCTDAFLAQHRFDKPESGIFLVGCMVHVSRKCVKVMKGNDGCRRAAEKMKLLPSGSLLHQGLQGEPGAQPGVFGKRFGV